MADPPPTRKVPAPVHELVRRIRDALPEWQQFRFTRNDSVAGSLFGDYYIIDLRTHVPILGRDIEHQTGRRPTSNKNATRAGIFYRANIQKRDQIVAQCERFR